MSKTHFLIAVTIDQRRYLLRLLANDKRAVLLARQRGTTRLVDLDARDRLREEIRRQLDGIFTAPPSDSPPPAPLATATPRPRRRR